MCIRDRAAVRSVLEARPNGKFNSLFEFLERIDIRSLNKRACEALIAAGAMDEFGGRAQLLESLDTAYGEVQARQSEIASGQESLFGDTSSLPQAEPPLREVPEWAEQDRLAREKEALGFFISGHPLDHYRDIVEAFEPVSSNTLVERAGQNVDLPCVVTAVARQISRRNNSEWGKITVEDFQGTATILAFGENWEAYKDVLQQDAVVLLSGKVSGRERDEDDPPVFLDSARPLEELTGSGELSVKIELDFGRDTDLTEEVFKKAKQVLASHPGASPVLVQVGLDNGAPAPHFRSRSLKVSSNSQTLQQLRKIFGHGKIRLVRTVEPSSEFVVGL